ncbi:hypothetical protein O3M35_011822 [Rhynocoris fuscipes]|uniref:DUF4485 domain-containing protein n=1 Tax=Rhynocoris fuscipes TaxID=488301 RepID=A0AAW1D2X0_9HEMI
MGMFELSRSTSKLSGLTQSDFTTEQSSLLHLEDSLTENMIAVWKFLDKKIKPEFKHLASWVTYLGTRSINNRLHVIKKQYMWYLRLSLEARIPCLPFTGAVLQPLPDFTKYMDSNNIAKTQYLAIMQKVSRESSAVSNDRKSQSSDWYSGKNDKENDLILPVEKQRDLIIQMLTQKPNKNQKIKEYEFDRNEEKIKNNLNILDKKLKQEIDNRRKDLNNNNSNINKIEYDWNNLNKTSHIEIKLGEKKLKKIQENRKPMPYKRLSNLPEISTTKSISSTKLIRKKSTNKITSDKKKRLYPNNKELMNKRINPNNNEVIIKKRRFPAYEYLEEIADNEIKPLSLNELLTKYERNNNNNNKYSNPEINNNNNNHKYIPVTKQIRDSINNIMKRVKFNNIKN